jgi:DNA-binding transcriptional regulator YhcF (GntR family)
MLKLHTKTADGVPSRIRSILCDEIKRGVYGASGRLPAERSLAERFGVSRTSVRECLNILVKDGMLVRLVGKGTFVGSAAGEFSSTLAPAGRLAFLIGENIFQFVQPGYTRILVGAEQAAERLSIAVSVDRGGRERSGTRTAATGARGRPGRSGGGRIAQEDFGTLARMASAGRADRPDCRK